MEAVVFEDSPLARYLQGTGGDEDEAHDSASDHDRDALSFAPRGVPTVRSRFRHNLPPPLRLNRPSNTTAAAIHNTCSRALNSSLGRADNAKFLEQFRYLIVASQLLSEHAYRGQPGHTRVPSELSSTTAASPIGALTLTGAVITASVAFSFVWAIHWVYGSRTIGGAAGRVVVVLTVIVVLLALAYAYIRRQWLQYLRRQTLAETRDLVSQSQGLDAVVSAAVTLIQEVELVSRGYRLSSPLPPITRLEDRGQNRRCQRLRRTLHRCVIDIVPRYNQAVSVLMSLAEQEDLEKYYDVYDISDMDLQEARQGYSEMEFEDGESLRVLKILVARLLVIRKVFLCCLLTLDADGGKLDFPRWSTVVDEIRGVTSATNESEQRLRKILSEEETFSVPATPKVPLTPARERWRAQLRRLNGLSTGIRSLQAKLHVLREESDKTLNISLDISDLGPNLMLQYDSIGVDLKALTQEWEDGRVALVNAIERNERRISSMSGSGILSPAISLGGLTSVEEGSPADALKLLNGEGLNRLSMELSSSDAEEVFEAIAIPKQRSTLTREERIVKMKVDRARRESLRDRADANTHMLRELESVINLRPRTRTTPTTERVMSI